MARPLSEAQNTAIVQFIIDNRMVGAKLQPLQDAVFRATGIKVSIKSGKLSQLRNEAAAKIQTVTEAAACQMREKEIKALDNAIDTTNLIENLAKMADQIWNTLCDPSYKGPVPRPKGTREYNALMDRYNALVANLAHFRPPPPPDLGESQLDPRFQAHYIVDMDAEIEACKDALMQRWLSKERVEAGGVKRNSEENLHSAPEAKEMPGPKIGCA